MSAAGVAPHAVLPSVMSSTPTGLKPLAENFWRFALVVAILLRITFFIVSVTHVSPTADEAIAVLQAKQVQHRNFPLLFMAQPYLFPIESYWMAPLVKLVPRNAFGARYLAAILWAASVAASLWICRKLADFRAGWPGMALALFPPAYALVHQAGMALPSYWGMTTFSWLIVLLLLRIQSHPEGLPWAQALSGLFCGLAFSSQPLSLCVAAVAGAAICLGTSWRTAVRNTLSYTTGALVGLLPFVLAWWRYHINPDVSGARSWRQVASFLIDSPLRQAVAKAIGFAPPSFPDGGVVVSLFGRLNPNISWAFLVLLGIVTIDRLIAFARRLKKEKWPTLAVEDLFPAAALLNLIFFAASRRSHIGSVRYLLPLIWTIPFLVVLLCARLRSRAFALVATAATVVALLNAATAAVVVRKWLEPRFAWSIGNFDLEPALEYLREHGISRCYASYWETYRIDFQTNEKILCSQPWNERFLGFPLPYKDAVDASPRFAYVLSPYGWLKPARFEASAAKSGMTYEKAERGDFVIYHDLHCALCRQEALVGSEHWDVVKSNPPEFARALSDPQGRWRSEGRQAKGMTVELALQAPAPLARVSLRYLGRDDLGRPPGLRFSAHAANQWITISKDDHTQFDPFEILDGRPIYDKRRNIETHRFPPIVADAVRIEITEPNVSNPWIIDGVELYRKTDS